MRSMLTTVRVVIIGSALPLLLISCEKSDKKTDRSAEVTPPATATDVPDTAPATEAGKSAQAVDYLSVDWARAAATRTEDGATEAEKLRQSGYALHQKEDDVAAIVEYEASLVAHPSGKTYYDYGNSLSNIERLPDSIKAYKIALKFGHARPEVVLYNIACAYSRMENTDGGYEFLQKAIAQGYSAWRQIGKDPDLKFLRGQNDWDSRYSAMKPLSLGFDPEKLVGEVAMRTERDAVRYTFCPNGKVLTSSPTGLDDDSC